PGGGQPAKQHRQYPAGQRRRHVPSAQNYSTGSGPRSVAVGDFNADGKLDLVTANANNLSVLPGNGDGTFQAPASIGIGSSPLSVAVGDFNADGKLDLTATSHVTSISNCYFVPDPFNYGYRLACDTTDTGLVSVLLGHGDGTFAAPNAYQLA